MYILIREGLNVLLIHRSSTSMKDYILLNIKDKVELRIIFL